MAYLDNLYNKLNAKTDFQKIVISAYASMLFQDVNFDLEEDDIELDYVEACEYIYGDFKKEAHFLEELAHADTYGVPCDDIFNMDSTKVKTIIAEYIRDNQIKDKYLNMLDTFTGKKAKMSKDLWVESLNELIFKIQYEE